MTRRAVVALGAGQLVNWGVLYYAFAVLLLPVEQDLGVAQWVVTGAFSLALLVSAAAAPLVGRWCDQGFGGRAIQAGGYAAAVLLAVWALFPSLFLLYVVWTGLGLCMAAALYEPAFAVIGRAIGDPTERFRTIAAITVFGALSSTVFLPLTAFLVRGFGWRTAVGVLAAMMVVSTFSAGRFALGGIQGASAAYLAAPVSSPPGTGQSAAGLSFGLIVVVFSVAAFANPAFTANLVPALGERAVSPTTAAVLGGLLGIMQLPGRALVMSGRFAGAPTRLALVSLLLQAAGFLVLGVAVSVPILGAAIAVFGVGAGLTTLVRPHLVQTLFGMERAGLLNGQLARWQQIARAAGPILMGWLGAVVGYSGAFLLLGALIAALAAILHRSARAGG